jgi:hypothetical protein
MVAAVAVSGTSRAAEPETVTNRERPEVDALGMPAGGFQLYPALGVEASYNDNIFADSTLEESDTILHLKPELDLRSNWNRHALNLAASADIGRYSDNGREDFEDYGLRLGGRLNVRADDVLTGKLGFAQKHVSRDSPNDRDGIEPTIYDTKSVSAAYRQRFNRLMFRVGAGLDRRDYDDVRALTGMINNDDQDRDEVEGLVQVNYEVSPRYSAFLRTRYKTIDSDDVFDDSGLARSSDGYEVAIGTELQLTGVLFGEVYAGKVTRDYDDPTLNEIDTVSGGGLLTWLPTQLTTVTFSAARDISETIVGSTSGILSTEGAVVVDHELIRNLLLQARLFARDEDFEGTGREDSYRGTGLGAKYLMNRKVYLSVDYDYLDRDSNTTFGDFTRNVIWLGIRGQL